MSSVRIIEMILRQVNKTQVLQLCVKQTDQNSRTLAMLIDGDNASPNKIKAVLVEAAKYGTVRIRHIFADWTNQQMASWKAKIHENAIIPMQQFSYTKGKNSTDGALIIDAMKILHSGQVSGFCIVSSDSDFTGLAIQLREQGMFVMGVGKECTPKSFISACDVFTKTEHLSTEQDSADEKNETLTATEQSSDRQSKSDWIEIVKEAVTISSQEDEWALLSDVGNNLRKINPAFDPRQYGFKKMLEMLKSEEVFEVRQTDGDENDQTYLVKLKS